MIPASKKVLSAGAADADLPPGAELDDAPADAEAETLDLPGLDLAEDEAAPASVRQGAAVIRGFCRDAPLGPGVYRMIAADGEVLYVGKAKSVRRRIASYARALGHNNRIARMIALTASMVFVSTETETEALLLETNYIKQMKPRFNVLMRDDKSFPYILLTGDHAAPQITKHRGARQRKGDYFGPFASVLGGQSHNERAGARLSFALLLGQFLREPHAPLPAPSDQALLGALHRRNQPCEDYARLVGEARDFLSGKSRAVRDLLAERNGRGLRGARSSSAPRACATASPRSPPSRARRASIRKASRRPMSSPSSRRPGNSASRRSSSGPIRTGATAPIFRAPTRASRRPRCSAPFSRSSTPTGRRRG